MSPTTARRTSSKEKNEWRTEKFNAQIRKCEKKIRLYKLIIYITSRNEKMSIPQKIDFVFT